MRYVSTASMSLIINGSPSTPFRLQRGLRYGYPLSPFIFLLIAEFFDKIVLYTKVFGYVEGIGVGRQHVELLHLQFADNTLVFAPANIECLRNYRRLLTCFTLMSGLSINFSKSALIAFGCDDSGVLEASSMLQCQVVTLPITTWSKPP